MRIMYIMLNWKWTSKSPHHPTVCIWTPPVEQADLMASGWITLSDPGLPAEFYPVWLFCRRVLGSLHPSTLSIVLCALSQQGPGRAHVLVRQCHRGFAMTGTLDQAP